jgi:ribose transport system permease protein
MHLPPQLTALLSRHGSLVILLALCVYYSWATLGEQHPVTPAAGRALAKTIAHAAQSQGSPAAVLIVVRDTKQDHQFAAAVSQQLTADGAKVLGTVAESPAAVRKQLQALGKSNQRVDYIATHRLGSQWGPLQPANLQALARQYPSLDQTKVLHPASYMWPSFLTRENLINVINQNAVIAIIAIGMTMVIVTGGIDLSVGSVLAISGVVTAIAVQELAGGANAGSLGLILCGLLGVAMCATCGAVNGLFVTRFRIPAFIVTLATMMIARGVALILAVRYQTHLLGGKTEGTPEAIKIQSAAFGWLGNGQTLGIPNPILLMLLLYVVAHVLMTRTVLGRYIYAVGGNAQAARLSGVPVFTVLILVYAMCGAMAGLAGVVDASRFEGGRPNAGEMYELQVIAAVVVGGASLAGGEGRIFGTLIGSLIIAVIQNGLNMAGVKSYEQKVVFGLLILAAVLLDQLKKRQPR